MRDGKPMLIFCCFPDNWFIHVCNIHTQCWYEEWWNVRNLISHGNALKWSLTSTCQVTYEFSQRNPKQHNIEWNTQMHTFSRHWCTSFSEYQYYSFRDNCIQVDTKLILDYDVNKPCRVKFVAGVVETTVPANPCKLLSRVLALRGEALAPLFWHV